MKRGYIIALIGLMAATAGTQAIAADSGVDKDAFVVMCAVLTEASMAGRHPTGDQMLNDAVSAFVKARNVAPYEARARLSKLPAEFGGSWDTVISACLDTLKSMKK